MLIFNTCAPKSIKAATLQSSITTGTSLAHPTKHTTGLDLEMEWEQFPSILFYLLPLLGLVLVQGQRGNVVNLLIVAGGGFDDIPLGPPILV